MPDIERLKASLEEIKRQLESTLSVVNDALESASPVAEEDVTQNSKKKPRNPISYIVEILDREKTPLRDTAIVEAVGPKMKEQGKDRPDTQVWISILTNSDENGPLAAMNESYGGVDFKRLSDRTQVQKRLDQLPGNLIGLREWLDNPPKK